jgi:pimeloyl-ACP methyl ester carboxylesterase
MKPCLLLVPEFTEVEWRIRPQLERWARVRSFDPPGVGAEPRPKRFSRKAIVRRGLDELDAWTPERVFIVADGWGIPSAAGIAAERPDLVAGMSLAHARLSNRRDGDDAPINPEIYAAMTRLIQTDTPSFIRFGIAQVTGGSVDEDHAQAMLARLPTDSMEQGWAALTADDPFAEMLADLTCPLLLAKHEGCLMSTDEGFAAAAAQFPDAQTIAVTDAPTTSPKFADALREFCLGVENQTRP